MRIYSISSIALGLLLLASAAMAGAGPKRSCPGQTLDTSASAENILAALINQTNSVTDKKKQACSECNAAGTECYATFDRNSKYCDHAIYRFSLGSVSGHWVQASFSIGSDEFCTVNMSSDGKVYFGYLKAGVHLTETTPETLSCMKLYRSSLQKEQKNGMLKMLALSLQVLEQMPPYLNTWGTKEEETLRGTLSLFTKVCDKSN